MIEFLKYVIRRGPLAGRFLMTKVIRRNPFMGGFLMIGYKEGPACGRIPYNKRKAQQKE